MNLINKKYKWDPSVRTRHLAVVIFLITLITGVLLSFNTARYLSGEIRAVNRIEQRISEAEKLGFERIIISKYNRKATEGWQGNIEVIPVATVEDVYRLLFP